MFRVIVLSGLVLMASGVFVSPAIALPSVIGKPGKAANVVRSIEVTMNDGMRFAPDRIDVRRGETIRLIVRNAGALRHELVLGRPADLKQHAELMRRHPHMEHDDPYAVSVPPGETRELIWRFSHSGQVDFGCLVPGHYEAGMHGKVKVN